MESNWNPESSRYPTVGSSYVFGFGMFYGAQGWIPTGVDSQKNRPDVSEVLGLAPPNTVTNRRDPFNFNGLRVSQNRPETVFPNRGYRLLCENRLSNGDTARYSGQAPCV